MWCRGKDRCPQAEEPRKIGWLARLVRFLWLVLRCPLGTLAILSGLIFAPIPWVTLTEPPPWWAYALGYVGSLMAIPLIAIGGMMVLSIPFMLAKKVMEAWRESK